MTALDERLGRIRADLGGLGYGGDYYPEQWDSMVWREDIELMGRAGVNLVTLGVFGWAEVEKDPGSFDFALFDQIIDDLHDAGIHVSLATMTASPPAWLAAAHPEMLPVRADGTRLWPGARQGYCPSSPIYREHAVRLVEQVAARYADHPGLAVWHVGNEYGVHVAECYCDESAIDFRAWLLERHGSIEALNEAWSTTFWSQRYRSFDEVLPPRSAPTFCNPAQQLDFARFSSDAMLACYRAELDVLRRLTPEVPVTTNFCGVWKPLDYWSWAPHLDLASVDCYPDPADPESHIEAAFTYDLVRSLKGGQPWLLMEQAPAAVNWRPRNATKLPGAMRRGSWQAVARGADAVMSFQWRQSRGGAEKWHSGMVPHAGPDSRTFREVTELGAELAETAHVAGTRVEADVAIVMDWPNWWALELDSHPSVDVTYRERLLAHYAPLFEQGVTCDVVPSTGDLGRYRLVVVPNLYLTTQVAAHNLTEYARAGGHVLVSFFSGAVDEHDRVHLGGYLGPLRELLGGHVAEWYPLPEGVSLKVELDNALGGVACQAGVWSEVVVPTTARVAATLMDGDLEGGAAVLRNDFGAGTSWYVATALDRSGMRAVLRAALEAAGVPTLPGLPAGVEVVVRYDDEHRVLFLLNHGSETSHVSLPDNTQIVLAPGGVATHTVLSAQERP